MRFSFLALLLFNLTPSIALSYVGPGMGGGAIAIVFGIFQKRIKAVYPGLFHRNGLLTVSPREADYRGKH